MSSTPLGPKLGQMIAMEKDPTKRAALEELLQWARRVVPDFQAACAEILQARASLGLGPEDGALGEHAVLIAQRATRLAEISERGAAGALRAKLGHEIEHGRALEALLAVCGQPMTSSKDS